MITPVRTLALALLLAPNLAAAQSLSNQSLLNSVKPNVGTAPAPAPRQPAPPALPGSRAEPAAVAPADRSQADMPPTEALFDAINRGDISVARDAIARGAELSGRNVLGMSPLELAVDLGRNDIAFLLLSLRGQGGEPRGGPPPTQAAEDMPRTRRQQLAERQAQAREERLARRTVAATPAAPAGPATPRLFARNGGAPAPDAGFLGFDPSR